MRTRLLFLLLLGPLLARAAPTAGELTEFFMPAEMAKPKLSPDGAYLGFIARRGDNYAVGIHNFATRKVGYSSGDGKVVPVDFWWKGPHRVLVQTTNHEHDALGYTAFDADGKNMEDVWHISGEAGLLYDALPAEPDNVLMLRQGELVKVNVKTDHENTISGQLPESIHSWVVDELGRPRAAVHNDSHFGETNVWFRAAADGDWRKRTFTAKESRFYPEAVALDPRYLLGWEFTPDFDITISRMDTVTGQVESFNRIPGHDPTDLLLLGRTKKPIAFAYAQGSAEKLVALAEADTPGIERMEQHFAGYEARIIDTMPDGKNWLLWVGNSCLPGAYVLFNHETSETSLVGLSHAKALSGNRLAPAEFFNFRSRAGGQLSARLWRPRDQSQLPLIVFCPGQLPAPVVEDVYQPEVQSFVRQGFAVLQVNVRNSWGYGKAGRQIPQERWINTLQEDLDDAVQSLVGQKVVDPARINLFGQYFGGVLALQVAARSKTFAAVAVINVPSEVHRDDLFNLTLEPGANPLAAKLGGWSESEKFAKELSPILIVPTLGIPALYLHNEEGSFKGRLIQAGREIRAAAQKAKAPAQSGLAYSWSQYPKLPTVLARESAGISLKVAAFFNQPLAVDPP